MGRVKELLFEELDQEAIQDRANALAEFRRAKAVEAEARFAQERKWANRHPAEWAEWERLLLLLDVPITFGDSEPFGFPEFLMEVGRQPSADHVVARVDESKPYQQGNLMWAAPTVEPPRSPYLNVEEAAAYLGVAVQTVYNNRRHIPSLPGFRTLMFDPKELERVRASSRFMSKRKSGR